MDGSNYWELEPWILIIKVNDSSEVATIQLPREGMYWW